MVRRLLPPVIFLLAGCALAPPSPPASIPVEVRVPIYQPVYCASGPVGRPELPIGRLAPNSTPAATVKAYAATVAILKGAVLQRDALLAGCAGPVATSAKVDQGTMQSGTHE